ncbi:MAG: cyanophycinase [Thermomicrobiales bacterium]
MPILRRNCSGIFVTGNDQARLVERMIGTQVMDTIRARNAEGVIVAGTSAEASLIAAHMLFGGCGIGGNSGDSAACKSMIEVVAGLGLLPNVVIDQHFSQRGRMGRLLSAFAGTPVLIGIGLDENTAVLVQNDGSLETLGERMEILINGRNTVSDYFNRKPGEVLTIINSNLHVLGPGRKLDLVAHAPIGAFKGTQ